MTIVAIVPAIVAVAGALVYLLTSKSEAKEIGRLMLATGLLVTLFVVAGKTVSL